MVSLCQIQMQSMAVNTGPSIYLPNIELDQLRSEYLSIETFIK
jgi:hypothetical protein